MRPPIDEWGKQPQTIDLEVTLSLRRVTLISSATLLALGSAVTPVAIASAHGAPPVHAAVRHTPKPVVTEVAPGSFTAVVSGIGTFTFKVDPVTRVVTDLVFVPAAGSSLTAGAPTTRDNGLRVVLRSATAKGVVEVEIEAERGGDPPRVSINREFDADHRDRGDRDDAGRGRGNGSNGGPPTTVMTTPTTVTVPAPPTTTTIGAPTNSSPGGPPSVNGGNDAADHDADGDNDGGDQDRGVTTGPNDQVDNDHGDAGGHGGDGPSADQGDHDSQGGGSGGSGNSGGSGGRGR
jgi:uncharacterized membrane protein YgcG